MAGEGKIPDDLAKTTAELVKATYSDALQPAAKEFGTTIIPSGKNLGEAVNAVTKLIALSFDPLRGMIWWYEEFKKDIVPKLAKRFEKCPDAIVPPRPSIAGPALDAMKWSVDEPVLRDLFVNLLATSMHRDKQERAHPAFANTISQLLPDEARIIKYLHIMGEIDVSGTCDDYDQRLIDLIAIPAKCENPKLVTLYMDNLARLGFVVLFRVNNVVSGKPATTDKKFSLMEFGKMFSLVCVDGTEG